MCLVSDLVNPHTISATTVTSVPVDESNVTVRKICISDNDGQYIINPVSVIEFVHEYNADLMSCEVEYLHFNGARSTTKGIDKFFKLPSYSNQVYSAVLFFLEDSLGVVGRGSQTYKYLCKLVKERDGKCFICGARGELQCHHVMGYKDYPGLQSNMGNCVSLCPSCHREYHDGFDEVNSFTFSCFLKDKVEGLVENRILESMVNETEEDDVSLILQRR